jgi:FolB domain-containing protein
MSFPYLTSEDGRVFDQVQLTGMLMSCVIGIFPSERSRKQPVTLDLCLYLDTRKAAQSANIHDTIDYAGAVKEISFILDHCEFLLIETAVEAICRHFLLTYQADHGLPNIDAVLVRISKPSALAHGIIPAVQILRRKEDIHLSTASTDTKGITRIHDAVDSNLTLIDHHYNHQSNALNLIQGATAALPIGKWLLNGNPVKSRIPIVLDSMSPPVFSISAETAGCGVIMIHSKPNP